MRQCDVYLYGEGREQTCEHAFWLLQYLKRNKENQYLYNLKLQEHLSSGNSLREECRMTFYDDKIPLEGLYLEDSGESILTRIIEGWIPSVDPSKLLDNNRATWLSVHKDAKGEQEFSAKIDITAPKERILEEISLFIDHFSGKRPLELAKGVVFGINTKSDANAPFSDFDHLDVIVYSSKSFVEFKHFHEKHQLGRFKRAIGLWLYDFIEQNPGTTKENAYIAFQAKNFNMPEGCTNFSSYLDSASKSIKNKKVLPIKR